VTQHQAHDLISYPGNRREPNHIIGLAQDPVSRSKRQLCPAKHDGRAKVLENQLVGRPI
jgi:hypothetical protein